MSLEGRIVENELMRAAMDAARMGLCVIAADGQVVMLGGDVVEKLGAKDASTFLGQHFRNLLVPGLLLNSGAEVFSLDAPETSAEARFSRPDGSLTMLLFQARTVVHGNDDRYRVLTVIDIANYGITRDRFVELRRQLDALNMAVIISDARLPDMPISHVNKRFEQMTGFAADHAVGRNCRFLQGTDHAQAGVGKLRGAIKRRQACHVVLGNFRKDGSAFQNELFISPVFDQHGELTQYVGLLREYTGRTNLSSRSDVGA
jgi:PAS domain S-box-containing protein